MITYLRHSRSEQLKIIFYVKYSSLFVYKHWRTFGPWWWSSGQRACLLLRKSKFKFRWSLQFCSLNYLKNLKNKKRPALLIFKKNIGVTFEHYDLQVEFIGHETCSSQVSHPQIINDLKNHYPRPPGLL